VKGGRIVVKESLNKILGLKNVEVNTEQIKDISLDSIRPNPFQPRKYFDAFQLEELAKSIKEYGVIQPIIVRKVESSYELIAGERRYRASQIIGNKTIPAIIRNMSDRDIAEMALIENLQREDLSYFEEAEGYISLINEFKLTQEEVAKRVGKSQSTIANKLRLLKLHEEVRKNITPDVITERHARALLKLHDKQAQIDVLKEIYENELNVRETDSLVESKLNKIQEEENKNNPKKIIRIFKDIRLYINTIKSAVNTIKEAGIDVKMNEKLLDEYVEIVIKIQRPKK
jgi:ParB family chromosome partitioning protein